jgi:hypothetical protein
MAEIRLDRPRLMAIIGELVTASMAQHAGVCLYQIGRAGGPEHGEAGLSR